MGQTYLFDQLSNDWKLPKLPNLREVKIIAVDTETTGLHVWKGARPIGLSIATEDCQWYLPWGHDEGPQFDLETVLAWMKKELAGKKLIFHHARFDLLMLWAIGFDARKFKCTFHDTMLAGALLDEYGRHGLDKMGKKYLNEEKKDIGSKERMQYRPVGVVGPYAEQDARLTYDLHAVLLKKMVKEELTEVYELECRVIPAVVEMEINGLKIDKPKLAQWITQSQEELAPLKTEIGINVNSSHDLQHYFDCKNWEYPYNVTCLNCDEQYVEASSAPECIMCGSDMVKPTSPHFGAKFLKSCNFVEAQKILRIRKLESLNGKFMRPWLESLRSDDILRFQLHQLRGDDYGTVSGRFSMSSVFGGSHPQQIWNPENQVEVMGKGYILRELFISETGLVNATDASQIEFRLFTHLSNDQRLIRAYLEDPLVDFHQMVATDILKGLLPRKQAKNFNFAILYGMGVKVLARELGVTLDEAEEMRQTYKSEFPAAKATAERVTRKAKSAGFIRTIFLRRARFPQGEGTHAALNRRIQGDAADLMKEALARVYEDGSFGTMRATVHDEIVSDVESPEVGESLTEFLGHTTKELRVPIIWKSTTGKTWAG